MKIFAFAFLFLTSFTVSAAETIYKWTGANDESCTAISPSGIAEKADLKKCLLKAPIKYAWSDDSQKKCAAYTPNNIFVALTEESNCKEFVSLECSPTLDTPESKLRTMIDGVLLKIIPEVLALKDGEAIPEKLLKEKDSRLIAASLVERLLKIEKKTAADDDKNVYDFYNDSEIQIAFNDTNLDNIRKGCFRNQFQTNSTNGADARVQRERAEQTLVGVKINDDLEVLETPNDISHYLRPKYAYFVPTKPMLKGYGHKYVSTYGNVQAVLKDEVKDRSTFTASDSLDLSSKDKAQPVNSKQNYRRLRTYKEDYWEAQVWGNLCLSDVSHLLINCPGKDNKKVSDADLEKMKETGIPVYQCIEEKKGVNTVYTKGPLLVSENSSKRKIDESKVNLKSHFPERRLTADTTRSATAEELKERHEALLKSPTYLIMQAEIELAFFRQTTPEGIAELKAINDKQLAEMKEAADEYSSRQDSERYKEMTEYEKTMQEELLKHQKEFENHPAIVKAKAEMQAHILKAKIFKENPTDLKAKEDYKKSLEEREQKTLKPGFFVEVDGTIMGYEVMEDAPPLPSESK